MAEYQHSRQVVTPWLRKQGDELDDRTITGGAKNSNEGLIGRRTLLAALGAALPLMSSSLSATILAARIGDTPRRRFAGPFGLELYSLRTEIARNMAGTLAMVRNIGYTEVEAVHGFWGPASVEELKRQLDDARLRCTSVQQPPERLRNDMAGVIRDARTLGVEYVVCGYISGAFRRAGAQLPGMFGPFIPLPFRAFREAAAEFNRWGKTLRKAGFKLGYHNHAYEFRLYGGHPGFDTLLSGTTPGLVDFEMDVFWVKRGGQNPMAYLKRYPRRFRLIHLKDMRKGTPVGDFSVGTSDEASVTLGTGIMDMRAILRAAAEAHVERYYVEDESAEAPEDIRVSYEYLKKVRF